MNSFFKTFWAAFLAFVAANFILGLFSFLFFVGLLASIGGAFSSGQPLTIHDGSMLHITLEDEITDAPVSSPLDNFDFATFKSRPVNSIYQVISAIESATVDSRIQGIYINPIGSGISMANAEELRGALKRFQESGKIIVSYADTYSQGQYYLASVADSVYINPKGVLDWHGFAARVMFYKGLLDKLGVEPVVLRHGSFKAAVEPYILDRMSPENALQMNAMISSVWGALVDDVAASRGISTDDMQRMATDLAVGTADRALEQGLVDRVLYNDEVKKVLNKLLDHDENAELHLVGLPQYIAATTLTTGTHSKNHVEIIYADGEIMDGESGRDYIGGATIAEKLAAARTDDQVKAVVLRVNSPGGSALASEVMWREVDLLKKEKPVVVSMGSMAASGGYYISCPADIVLANRSTLTGSIGVFGLMMNVEKALKDKLGITVDVVRTNPSSDVGSPFRPITDAERAYIMQQIEDIYSTFVTHVAVGRNLTYEQVDAIGQGRVWSGVDAKQIGLVDGFGGLREAINLAADRAGVAADFMVTEAIDAPDPFTAFFSAFSEARASKLEAQLGVAFTEYKHMLEMLSQQGIQARMPYTIEIE